jgi:hypothetical protein
MTTKPTKTRTTINLPSDLHQQVIALANENARTVSGQIEFMVKAFINQQQENSNGR